MRALGPLLVVMFVATMPATSRAECTPEVCDGVDNDCDGSIDEGASGVGASCGDRPAPCRAGITACVNGSLVCQGNVAPLPEVCDGIDNDCNGSVDDGGLADAPPAGQSGCWANSGNCCSFGGAQWCPPAGATCGGSGTLTGQCRAGTLACVDGGWSCTSAVAPSPELCNGADDNCDGTADNVPGTGSECGSAVGECRVGTLACVDGALACSGAVTSTIEVCDGLDNDCDGFIDKGAVGVGATCGVSTPPCSLGFTACINGALVCQGGVEPRAEQCDGIDNDCNGTVDDGTLADAPPVGGTGCWQSPGNCCSFGAAQWCPPPGATCSGTGILAGPCQAGSLACMGGGWACNAAVAPSTEQCNGVDDDCDGATDDDIAGTGAPCGSDVGECVAGSTSCLDGALGCAGEVPARDEVCDGADNDCDGAEDESLPSEPCVMPYDTAQYPGAREQGACSAGTQVCGGAEGVACVGGVGPAPERCNGIDDDCDGLVDELGVAPDGIDGTPLVDDALIGDACDTGVPSCPAGVFACENGAPTCRFASEPGDETCNGLDDDCDGLVDEADGAAPCGETADCVKASDGVATCSTVCDPESATPCAEGLVCVAVRASGTGDWLAPHCAPDPCSEVACDELEVCVEGTCVAVAPDAGTDGGEVDGGVVDGGAPDAGGTDAGEVPVVTGPNTTDDATGCTCGGKPASTLLPLFMLVFVAFMRRRPSRVPAGD